MQITSYPKNYYLHPKKMWLRRWEESMAGDQSASTTTAVDVPQSSASSSTETNISPGSRSLDEQYVVPPLSTVFGTHSHGTTPTKPRVPYTPSTFTDSPPFLHSEAHSDGYLADAELSPLKKSPSSLEYCGGNANMTSTSVDSDVPRTDTEARKTGFQKHCANNLTSASVENTLFEGKTYPDPKKMKEDNLSTETLPAATTTANQITFKTSSSGSPYVDNPQRPALSSPEMIVIPGVSNTSLASPDRSATSKELLHFVGYFDLDATPPMRNGVPSTPNHFRSTAVTSPVGIPICVSINANFAPNLHTEAAAEHLAVQGNLPQYEEIRLRKGFKFHVTERDIEAANTLVMRCNDALPAATGDPLNEEMMKCSDNHTHTDKKDLEAAKILVMRLNKTTPEHKSEASTSPLSPVDKASMEPSDNCTSTVISLKGICKPDATIQPKCDASPPKSLDADHPMNVLSTLNPRRRNSSIETLCDNSRMLSENATAQERRNNTTNLSPKKNEMMKHAARTTDMAKESTSDSENKENIPIANKNHSI